MNILEKIDTQLDSYRDAMVEMQKKLTAFAAVGPDSDGPGEMEKAMWLKQWMIENGLGEAQEYNAPDDRVPAKERPNLILKLAGNDKEKTVWVLAHTDVVPEGDLSKWDTDPFEVIEKDGRLYGRGTEDNQQGLVSGLFAAKALIDLGIDAEYNIGLALVADEETGSQYGLHYLMKNHSDIFSSDDLVIIPDAGSSDVSHI